MVIESGILRIMSKKVKRHVEPEYLHISITSLFPWLAFAEWPSECTLSQRA